MWSFVLVCAAYCITNELKYTLSWIQIESLKDRCIIMSYLIKELILRPKVFVKSVTEHFSDLARAPMCSHVIVSEQILHFQRAKICPVLHFCFGHKLEDWRIGSTLRST